MLLVFASPLLLFISIMQLILTGRPLFFRQQRIGLNGKSFSILKFRTMRNGEGDDAKRLTAWGRLLRSTSMDELPQLWNVLRGEMSLVGPRPLAVQYLSRYSSEQARRHTIKPGITGWAQVNGRNNISWEHQFELDLWYIDNRNWRLDLKILLLTAVHVLTFRNSSKKGYSTRSEFKGVNTQD